MPRPVALLLTAGQRRSRSGGQRFQQSSLRSEGELGVKDCLTGARGTGTVPAGRDLAFPPTHPPGRQQLRPRAPSAHRPAVQAPPSPGARVCGAARGPFVRGRACCFGGCGCPGQPAETHGSETGAPTHKHLPGWGWREGCTRAQEQTQRTKTFTGAGEEIGDRNQSSLV